MIFYYIENKKVYIVDFTNKQEEVIEDVNRLQTLADLKKTTWIGWDLSQRHALKNMIDVTIYDVKNSKDNNLEYYELKLNKSKLECIIELFFLRVDMFLCKRTLIKDFQLPQFLLNRNLGTIVEWVLQPKKAKKIDFYFLDIIKLNKYKYILDFFKNNKDSVSVLIAGIEHKFTRGGLHGQRKNYRCKGDIIYLDVKMFYPSILHNNKLGFENIGNLENLKLIHDLNLKLQGNKRIPFKLADNLIVGKFKDKFSSLYNPVLNEIICINGQLLLLMLIEMIEPYINLIQTNTDGLIVECLDFDNLDLAVEKWEKLTNLKVKFEYYDEIFQKDVNNYVLLGEEIKLVGELKENTIINEAIVSYLINKTSIEETILNCSEKSKFQFVINLSDKYLDFKFNNQIYKKAIRVYAYNGGNTLYWRINKYEKVPNTPKYCSLEKISKDWYIQEAYKKIRRYGC